jgi:hypothetical protein
MNLKSGNTERKDKEWQIERINELNKKIKNK